MPYNSYGSGLFDLKLELHLMFVVQIYSFHWFHMVLLRNESCVFCKLILLPFIIYIMCSPLTIIKLLMKERDNIIITTYSKPT